jgi:ADP-ribose pyrophosphatase YjhB (NUDIX family)
MSKNWKFCPVCAAPLITKEMEGQAKLACHEDHFVFYNNPVPVVAALVLTTCNDGRDGLVLVKRGVWPFIGEWCLPRGFIDTNERPKQAVAREVREEAGLYVWLKRILCQFNPSPPNLPLNQVTTVFLATIRGGTLQHGSDTLEAKVFAFDELPPLCFATDTDIVAQWRSGKHGTIEQGTNFPQRSTIVLDGEISQAEKPH